MSARDCSISSMPRSRSSTSALTMLMSSSSALASSPAATAAVISLVSFAGHFAAIVQPAGLGGAAIHLGQQQTQPIAQVQIIAQGGRAFSGSSSSCSPRGERRRW